MRNRSHDAAPCSFHGFFAAIHYRLCQVLRSQVGGHNDDGVLEIHGPALAIGQQTVVKDLTKNVEHSRTCLLHLIEEDDTVWAPPDLLRQLTAILMATIASSCQHKTINYTEVSVNQQEQQEHSLKERKNLGCAPMRRSTDPGPTNSDMSKRISIFSLSKSCSARAFASSVFPTPVEPRKRKEPIGWPRLSSPALERITACATKSTASFCPTTRSCNRSARWINFSFSSLDQAW
jgi:hypothetical protein